ncbi:hypothetical protein BACCAP_02062 [Pseudoflavonifractor capillosus ATCC 29799]|uniref:Uncharacterized protein n=1 Tax=Pseudoflavonifractor capillosus ATCC 29799 TaxID=411467 RepID=A6NV27_9FIRM|nr:hypothetical protein BACCAP_02062 [Pseudoflavonifractor capillosus ATCC 29799]
MDIVSIVMIVTMLAIFYGFYCRESAVNSVLGKHLM